jgi:RimJ/RimL family protein N-acetyltransferase
MNRVSFCTDARNLHSQAAIEKLGAVKEGTMRSHMITQGGRIRDTVLYAIVLADWPAVKDRLNARLTGQSGPPAPPTG